MSVVQAKCGVRIPRRPRIGILPRKVVVYALYWDPKRKRVRARAVYTFTFGDAAAVLGYNRVAQGICALATDFLTLLVDHFFDDYWGWSSAEWSHVHSKVFAELHDLSGFRQKNTKHLEQAKELPLKGLMFEPASDGVLISNQPEKRSNI